jgi:hypothetical protein
MIILIDLRPILGLAKAPQQPARAALAGGRTA